MRNARTLTIMLALIFGGLTFQLTLENVQAADVLESTHWSNGWYDFYFDKGGEVEIDDGDKSITGTYKLNGKSVEMTFKNDGRATAVITGNEMVVKLYFSASGVQISLTKQSNASRRHLSVVTA